MQLFIDSQGFTGIDNLTMLCIKDVPNMIKDHNLVPNQEACVGAIQKCKLQELECWAKDRHRHGLAITVDAWTAAELTIITMKINI